MKEIYFKQMDVYSNAFKNECIETFSFDRIAHTVNQAIIDQLTNQGWTLPAAVTFIQSKAMRWGLDQTLGEMLEKAAQDWIKQEANEWKADCHQWAQEQTA
jgi:hypothetical protein